MAYRPFLLWPFLLSALLFSNGANGQADTLRGASEAYLVSVVRGWARESVLGDLATGTLPDSALELRLWGGFGLTGTRALVLARSNDGVWTAKQVKVGTCVVLRPNSDSLTAARIEEIRKAARRKCPPLVMAEGQLVRVDTLAVGSLPLPPNPDSVWQRVLEAGILDLPPRIARTWMMRDGYTHVVELRRGRDYRVSSIEGFVKPEVPADEAMRQIFKILSAAYAWQR